MASRTVTLSRDQLTDAVLKYVNQHRAVLFPTVKGKAVAKILVRIEWSEIYTDITIDDVPDGE